MPLAWTALLAGASWAADFRADEDDQEVSGSVDDDVYVAGDQTLISGDVTGDVFAVGRRIRVTGSTGASFFAGAQNVEISGTVGHSARIGAQEIEVTGTIERDLLAGGQSVEIAEGARVGRDVVAGTQDLDIAGRVDGNVLAGAASLTISGTVGGDVEVESQNVTLEDGARIEGDLIYTSANEADIDDGAEVVGEVERREPRAGPADDERNPVVDAIVGFLRDVVGATILGLALLWLLPGLLPTVASTIRSDPFPSLGVGIGALFLTPIVALIVLVPALILGAGASLVFVLLAVWGFLLLLAKAAVGLLLGSLILRKPIGSLGFRDATLCLLAGVAVIALVTMIPFLGGLVGFVVSVLALGAGLVAFARWRKARAAVPPPPTGPATPEVAAA